MESSDQRSPVHAPVHAPLIDEPSSHLGKLLGDLPEIYQTIFGHPELSNDPARICEDRLRPISALHATFAQTLGRPVRILDLGCAQGFFSLSLASEGAEVLGVDMLAQNIAVCQALAMECPGIKVRFAQSKIEDVVEQLEPDSFDLVMGLSVFHHLCHQQGADYVRRLLATIAATSSVFLYEAALASEPLDWAASLPDDPRVLLQDFAFVHNLGEHTTHLSDVARPLFFASNGFWYLGRELSEFDSWTDRQHELCGTGYAGTRRYFFSEAKLAKHFLLGQHLRQFNILELEREAAFLSSPPRDFAPVPQLYEFGFTSDEAWLVRERLPGTRLSEMIAEGRDYEPKSVLADVLGQLATLESAGLYHNDVRVWNVFVGADGRSYLIDFGSITSDKQDVVWPSNPFLSFLNFALNVTQKRLPDHLEPTRPPLMTPGHFPSPYREWVDSIWQTPAEEWTFALFLRKLQTTTAHSISDQGAGELGNLTLWLAAHEAHLDEVSRYQLQTREQIVNLSNILLRDQTLAAERYAQDQALRAQEQAQAKERHAQDQAQANERHAQDLAQAAEHYSRISDYLARILDESQSQIRLLRSELEAEKEKSWQLSEQQKTTLNDIEELRRKLDEMEREKEQWKEAAEHARQDLQSKVNHGSDLPPESARVIIELQPIPVVAQAVGKWETPEAFSKRT